MSDIMNPYDMNNPTSPEYQRLAEGARKIQEKLDRFLAPIRAASKERSNYYQALRNQYNARGFPSLTDSDYSFLNEIQSIINHPGFDGDAEFERDRIFAAAIYANNLRQPIDVVYRNLDVFHEQWTKQKFVKKTGIQTAIDSVAVSFLGIEHGGLAAEYHLSGQDPEVLKRLQEVDQKIEKLKDKVPKVWEDEYVRQGGFADLLPALRSIGITTLENVVPMAIAAGTGYFAGAGAGALVKSLGLPAGMSGKIVAGASMLAVAESTALTTVGTEYYDLISQGIPDDIAWTNANISAQIQGAIEAVGGGVVSTTTKRLLKSVAPGAIEKAAARWFIKGKMGAGAKAFLDYLQEVAGEGLEEGAQQITSIAAYNMAAAQTTKRRDELLQKIYGEPVEEARIRIQKELEKYPAFDQKEFDEIWPEIAKAAIGGMGTALLLGVPGAGIGFRNNKETAAKLADMARKAPNEGAFLEAVNKAKKEEGFKIPATQELKTDDEISLLSEVYKVQQERMTPEQREAKQKAAQDAAALSEVTDYRNVDVEAVQTDDKETIRTELTSPDTSEIYQENGRLEINEYTDTNEDGSINGRFVAGDPRVQDTERSGINQYGYINYTETDNEVAINEFKMLSGYESLRPDLFRQFAERFAGKNIQWTPQNEQNISIKDRLANANPRGPKEGLNYYEQRNRAQPSDEARQIAERFRPYLRNSTPLETALAVETFGAFYRRRGESLGGAMNRLLGRITNEAPESVIAAQAEGRLVKGATWLEKTAEGMRRVVYVNKNAADSSTVVHEISHAVAEDFTEAERDIAARALNGYKLKNGVTVSFEEGGGPWTDGQHEAFAEALENYLTNGAAPNDEIRGLFERIKEFMKRVYRTMKGWTELSPEAERFYKSLLSGELVDEAALESSPRTHEEGPGEARQWKMENDTVNRPETPPEADIAGQRDAVITDPGVSPENKAQAVMDAAGDILMQALEEDREKARRQYAGVYARYHDADGKPGTGWLKAPNGNDTNLTEEQWVQVRTKNFKEWFGDWESIAEIAAMEARIAAWTSRDTFNSAAGKSREEIFKEYDNTLQPIAYVPEQYLSSFSGIASDNRVYCGQAYFLDHAVNHHPEITIAEYGNLQEILSKPDEVIIDKRIDDRTKKKRDNLLFTKKYGTNLMAVISLEEEEDGRILLHKSLYGHKKSPYPGLPRVQGISSGGGPSPIGRTAEAIPGGNLPARDDTLNIDDFVRPVNPSEVSQVRDANGEPAPVFHGTRAKFEAFSLEKAGTRRDSGMLGKGFYFSTDKYAASAGDPITLTLFANTKNPLYLKMEKWSQNKSETVSKALGFDGIKDSAEIRDKIIQSGYDGVVLDYSPLGYEQKEIMMLNPEQVKSATDNTGTFDITNPSILFQTAYHGTPHQVDRFDTARIGTGEGSQAYGWGLYFAGSKEVAEYYRKTLSGRNIGFRAGKLEFRHDTKGGWINTQTGEEYGGTIIEQIISETYSFIKNPDHKNIINGKPYMEWIERTVPFLNDPIALQIFEAVKTNDTELIKDAGHLYEVDIPDDNELLDWDKPLSEQPVQVRSSIETLIKENPVLDYVFSDRQSISGMQFYRGIVEQFGTDRAVSNALNGVGIKGIRYLDNASRASGHGFCNYVIFDDSVISEPTLLFQAGDRDMMEEAADFEDGKDFRAYIETFFELPKEVDGFTDEQIDAWFDEFVKKAKEAVRSGEQGSETSAPAGGKPAPAEVDREFNELIGEPGKLDEFVDSLTKAHNEDYDDWQALDAEDEAERGRQMETTDILRRKLTHPTWQSIFKANGEMGPVQRKQLLTLIRKAPREYRAIYAEVMNRPEYAVSAEDTTAEALKYRITDSRRESVDNLTPEKLRQLAEQLDIDTFAEKVKTGRALFNDPAEKAYIKQLQGQIKEVEQTLKEVEADRNEDNEYIERMAGKQFLDTFNRAVEAREEIRRSKDKLDKAVAAQKKDARSLVWKAQRVTANYNSIVQTLESLARARKLELDIRDILENQRIHDAVQAAKKELKTEAREKIDALKDEVKKVRAREREKASVQRKFAAIMAARDMKAHLEDLQERRENRKIYTDAKRKVVKRITRQINTREVNAEQGMAAAIIQRLAEPSMLEGLDRFIGGIEKPYLRTIFETWKVDETLRTGILKDKAKAAQDKMTRIFEKKSFDHLTNEEKKYLYRVIPPNDWAEALGLEDIIRIRNENYPTMNGEAERQIALKYLPPDVYYRIMDKPFSEWTLEEAEELAKIIDNLIVRGKEIRKADIDAEKQRIKAYQKAVVETIGTVAKRGLADSPDDTPEERARKKAGREKILNEFDEGTKGTAQAQARRRNFKGPVLGYADMNMFHFARMLDNGETGGKNGAALYRRPGDAYNMKMAAIDSRTERIEKVMTEQKITKTELWGKTVEIDLGGDLGKAAFTAAELIGFLSAIRDDYSREAVMYGNLLSERERGPYQQDGITEAELAPLYDLAEGRFFQVKKAAEKLIAETSGYRKLLEAIDADFTEGGKRLSQALIRYNNTYMPIVDKYFPINRQAPVTVQGADASLARDLMGASTGGFNLFVEKGFTNKRQAIPAQYQTAIKLDILGVWTDAVSREEHFMAYGQLVKDLNAIYKGNRQVKDAIERRYGRQAVDYINKYVNELANPAPDRVRSTFDKAIRAMRGNAPAAFLGWKVSSIVKQFITSPAPFLGYMNPLEYWGTFVEYATRQEESWKEITDLSEHMKHRSANLLTDLVKEQAKRTFENKMDAAISKMSERGIQGLEWIDRMCVAPGWMVLYRTELKRLTGGNTDGTLTERDAKVKAAQYADDIIRATQPSARPEDIAPLFKGNSELGKAYLQFTQSLNIIWQNIRYDVPQMIRDRRYKNAAGLIMGYILSGIMLGAITEGFDDDDDETARALRFAKWAAQQFTDSFPIIGSEATHFAELAITGKARHQSGLNLVPAFQKIRNAAESGVKGAREQDFDRFLKAAATAAEGAAIFKGLPVSGIKEAGLILGISGDEEPGIHPETVLGRR